MAADDPLERLASFTRAASPTAYAWEAFPNRESKPLRTRPAISDMRWARRAAVVLLAASALAGCGTRGWTLMVENGSDERRIIRVSDGNLTVDRSIEGLSNEWVVVSQVAPTGPVTVLDPVTCEVLAMKEEIPEYHTVMVIDPGQIFLGESGPGTLPDPNDVAPESDDCLVPAP